MGWAGGQAGSGGAVWRDSSLAVVGFCEVGRVVGLGMVSVGGWGGLWFGGGGLVGYGAVLAGDAGGDAAGG